jgi:hypothetical protein
MAVKIAFKRFVFLVKVRKQRCGNYTGSLIFMQHFFIERQIIARIVFKTVKGILIKKYELKRKQ